MSKNHKVEIINGKLVILLNGNLIEKGFTSYFDAEKRADELNANNTTTENYQYMSSLLIGAGNCEQ